MYCHIPRTLLSAMLNLFFFFFLSFFIWLGWVFVAARGLSLVAVSGATLRCGVRTCHFSLRWLLLLQSTGSRHMGFSTCGTQAQLLWLVGSRAQVQQSWRTGFVAPQHVGSSQTRAQTCVPCIGRRILNHCTTREVLLLLFYNGLPFCYITLYGPKIDRNIRCNPSTEDTVMIKIFLAIT